MMLQYKHEYNICDATDLNHKFEHIKLKTRFSLYKSIAFTITFPSSDKIIDIIFYDNHIYFNNNFFISTKSKKIIAFELYNNYYIAFDEDNNQYFIIQYDNNKISFLTVQKSINESIYTFLSICKKISLKGHKTIKTKYNKYLYFINYCQSLKILKQLQEC